jgi:hypothetical protein
MQVLAKIEKSKTVDITSDLQDISKNADAKT